MEKNQGSNNYQTEKFSCLEFLSVSELVQMTQLLYADISSELKALVREATKMIK